MKIVSIVAALFIVTCLFISTTVAESKVVEKKEITHVEIKKTGERAGGGERNPLITDSIEKRKATLKVSFGVAISGVI